MKFLKKLLGICETKCPADEGCWTNHGDIITIGLNRAREILRPGGAIRIEGKGIADRILVFHGLDGRFYAVKNKCSHIGGRRVDPSRIQEKLVCCSISGSVYRYDGEVISGPAKKPLKSYDVTVDKGQLVIHL